TDRQDREHALGELPRAGAARRPVRRRGDHRGHEQLAARPRGGRRRLTTRPARPPPARRYSTPSPQPDRPDPAPMTRPQRDFTLDPPDTERLANLAGPFDAHLRQIELRMGVEIANRGNVFRVTGADE